MASPSIVRAAGCVVWRPATNQGVELASTGVEPASRGVEPVETPEPDSGVEPASTGVEPALRGVEPVETPEPEVLLIHRPRWSDWSFPKGKLDPGETDLEAAIREVREETGLRVRLGPRLPDQHYAAAGGPPKVVTYWSAQSVADSDVQGYQPNAEVDQLRWMAASRARDKLSYSRDRALLDAFVASGYDSSPLLVIRHAEARKRGSWRGNDSKRPLRAAGHAQASRLVALLSAYGVSRVASSDALRCIQTVDPYVRASGAEVSVDPVLSEAGYSAERFGKRVRKLLEGDDPAAVCTHRPQLAPLFEIAGGDVIGLMPAEVVVLHRRGGQVVDVEQHAV